MKVSLVLVQLFILRFSINMIQPSLTYIEELADGNEAFKAKLIEIVKQELPEEIELYYKHVEAQLYSEAAKDVHKLKHKISILGLEKEYHLAVAYEEALREDHCDGKIQFEDILSAMSLFVKSI